MKKSNDSVVTSWTSHQGVRGSNPRRSLEVFRDAFQCSPLTRKLALVHLDGGKGRGKVAPVYIGAINRAHKRTNGSIQNGKWEKIKLCHSFETTVEHLLFWFQKGTLT